MAKTYNYLTEEEKIEKILLIADYVIATKCSIRKAADYATQNGFKISGAGVHRILHVNLKEIDKNRYHQVMAILKNNLPQGVEIAEVSARVYKVASLCLQDFIIPEIASLTGYTIDVIYDDLTTRLPKLDEKLALLVKRKLVEHRLENLGQYKNELPNNIVEKNLYDSKEENLKK